MLRTPHFKTVSGGPRVWQFPSSPGEQNQIPPCRRRIRARWRMPMLTSRTSCAHVISPIYTFIVYCTRCILKIKTHYWIQTFCVYLHISLHDVNAQIRSMLPLISLQDLKFMHNIYIIYTSYPPSIPPKEHVVKPKSLLVDDDRGWGL